MSRIIDALARRRWPLFLLVIVFSAVALVAVSPDGSGSRVALVITATAAVAFVFILGLNLAGHDPDADSRALSLDPDPVNAELLSRWMKRSKHFRFVGGMVGSIVGFGLLDNNVTPVILSLLAGIALGGALAELHSLRRRPSMARSADMAPRRLDQYVSRIDTIALVAVGVGALAIMAGALVGGRPNGGSVVFASLGALAIVGATSIMQRLVVLRPRPALPADLKRADDLMRRLAATQGFTRPAIALAIGLLATALTSVGTGPGYSILAVVLLVLATAWYVSSRQSRANLLAVGRS